MRFVSKVDGWMIPVMIVTIAGMIWALIAPANKAGFLSAIDNSTRRDET